MLQGLVSVRYMIDDVSAAVQFYTKHLGFTLEQDVSPAFASVTRGNLRLFYQDLSLPRKCDRLCPQPVIDTMEARQRGNLS